MSVIVTMEFPEQPTLQQIKDRCIGDALRRNNFNVTAAARELDVTTKVIYSRLRARRKQWPATLRSM